MRLKLVLISALIATVVGASTAIAIILLASSAPKPSGLVFIVATFLLPALTTLLASMFVYRHTARRRKLQAMLTAIIALLLTMLLFLLAPIVTRPKPLQPQPARQNAV
jgi:uncharacterized membrane-anchored protein